MPRIVLARPGTSAGVATTPAARIGCEPSAQTTASALQAWRYSCASERRLAAGDRVHRDGAERDALHRRHHEMRHVVRGRPVPRVRGRSKAWSRLNGMNGVMPDGFTHFSTAGNPTGG
jgi:hypothetical protein